MKQFLSFIFLMFTFFNASAQATIGPVPIYLNNDPIEDVNRAVYEFNDALDKSVLKPVAESYETNMPDDGKKIVKNFFANIADFETFINQLLQLKIKDSVSTFSKIILNSTVGIFGLADVAGHSNHNEDFGQTLATWGVPDGPYVVLPLLGPSNARDSLGMIVDSLSPSNILGTFDSGVEISLKAVDAVDTRADLIPLADMLDRSFDPYITMKSSYQQKRNNDINDGNKLD